MQNPFESGQIKNYILLYASIVVIMVLFFFATTLFNENEKIEQKHFSTEINASLTRKKIEEDKNAHAAAKQRFKLLKEAY